MERNYDNNDYYNQVEEYDQSFNHQMYDHDHLDSYNDTFAIDREFIN